MIILSIGHHEQRKGCRFTRGGITYHEYDMAKKWCQRIQAMYPNEILLIPPGTLKEKVTNINWMEPTFACDLHFNSAPKFAGEGYEILHHPVSVMGQTVSRVMDEVMGLTMGPSRGCKAGYYRMDKKYGIDFYLRRTNCPAVILECEFIHHIDKILDTEPTACRSIAHALIQAERALLRSFEHDNNIRHHVS